MKFTVSSAALNECLQANSRFVPAKSTKQMQTYFLFQLQDKDLTITSTDGETTLLSYLTVEDTDESGSFAIPAKVLLDIMGEFGDQPLTLQVDLTNYAVLITVGKGKYSYVAQPADAYPQAKGLGEQTYNFSLPAPNLCEALNQVSYAVEYDEMRPIMGGIYFDTEAEQLTLVGTDAHKLARVSLRNLNLQGRSPFAFPKKPAQVLERLLAKDKDEVTFTWDSEMIVVDFAGYRLITRQLEGRYPNYNSIVPHNITAKLIVDRETLFAAVRRVSACMQKTDLLKLVIRTNEIYLTGRDIDFSQAGEETIPCQYEGPEIEIGFKAPLLVDVLANMRAMTLELSLIDSTRPLLLSPVESSEIIEVLVLLMPMMLN